MIIHYFSHPDGREGLIVNDYMYIYQASTDSYEFLEQLSMEDWYDARTILQEQGFNVYVPEQWGS